MGDGEKLRPARDPSKQKARREKNYELDNNIMMYHASMVYLYVMLSPTTMNDTTTWYMLLSSTFPKRIVKRTNFEHSTYFNLIVQKYTTSTCGFHSGYIIYIYTSVRASVTNTLNTELLFIKKNKSIEI